MTDHPITPDDDTVRGGTRPNAGTPKRIGQYSIKREIARGGMGVVFEAVQDQPRRTVAIKVMKQGVAGEEALRRFRYESQLLARLRHPGIAQVYEAGTHDDGSGEVPFFAMEYIPNAKPIITFAQQKKLGVKARLELFARVCDAVHHGHQRGIIHRDLKPSNILIDSHGQPRIIDFGVARATDSDMATIQTEVGQIIGSLQYMSPEQFEADPNDIDTRSDVYALGVVLYELVRGELPYNVRNTTIIEAARIVRDHAPPRLSQTDPSLRGDIETIVLKALEKDRDRRYQSAYGLASDIRRYLNGEPIAARPPSLGYQMRIFARRHKTLIGAATAVVVVLIGAAVLSTTAWVNAERERQRAEAETEKTRAAVGFLKAMVSSSVPSEFGDDVTLHNVLDEAAKGVGVAFPDDPLTEADLHATLAWGYLNIHAWAKTEEQARAALDIRRRVLGPTHEKTMETLGRLSFVYTFTAQLDEQADVLRELIAAEEQVYGAESEETLASKANLALVLTEKGNLREARDVAEDLVEVRKRVLGEEAPLTLNAEIVHALITLWQERYDESERMSREVFETCRRVLGDGDDLTRRARSQLGAVLLARGQIEAAKALYGNKPAPERLGVTGVFQGEVASYTNGANVYIFWESW